jgi:hypothetical protein
MVLIDVGERVVSEESHFYFAGPATIVSVTPSFTSWRDSPVVSLMGFNFLELDSLQCKFDALSRAAILSYFAVILIYSFITKRREILSIFYLSIVLFVVYLFSFSSKDIQDFVMDTITFSNQSSVGHLAEWLIGLESMIAKPLGLGIGASGGITANEGNAVGGENQFIIVGVQIGIAGLLLYAWIHFYTMYLAYKNYKILKGKEQKIAMTVLLIRAGMFLPMFTSNLDTFIYISYLMWFMTGLLSNILSKPYAHLEHETV